MQESDHEGNGAGHVTVLFNANFKAPEELQARK